MSGPKTDEPMFPKMLGALWARALKDAPIGENAMPI
jgi:hypothetical protein